ncbi:hypothetical protein VPJ68_09435, partial [Parabacteroides distasonis]
APPPEHPTPAPSLPSTTATQARGFRAAKTSGGCAVSRDIFPSLRCERIYRETAQPPDLLSAYRTNTA